MSSNSVIPAQAGIHRKTWETLIWKTVSEFQKWIPACAGMTADDYDRRRIKNQYLRSAFMPDLQTAKQRPRHERSSEKPDSGFSDDLSQSHHAAAWTLSAKSARDLCKNSLLTKFDA